MLKKNVKKLWQGTKVSIRDYELEKAKRLGGLEISHNGQKMRLTPKELKWVLPHGKVHQSKYKGSYQLADITWKPLTENPDQGKLI
jgi:hypothetical protein|tara:strand:- start:2609 stop:2866 length:258 start_codon:yes stop_codon:yes gene_type:complete